MWDNAIGWLVALVVGAMSANLLASRTTHQLRRIKAEAEVLALLPDGEQRARLEQRVTGAVAGYLDERESPRSPRADPFSPAAGAAQVLGTLLLLAAAFMLENGASPWLSVPAAVVGGAAAIGVSLLQVREQRR